MYLGISTSLKILAALRFLATGSYQLSIGQDFCSSMAQSTISEKLDETLNIMNKYLVRQNIKFPKTLEEKNIVKQSFFNVSGIGGIIGAVDGTLIPLLCPTLEPHSFYCRKRFHAINAMLVS